MREEYSHLLPATRPLAQAMSQERVRHIKLDRWIGYPRAEEALALLEELFEHPQRTRMPNAYFGRRDQQWQEHAPGEIRSHAWRYPWQDDRTSAHGGTSALRADALGARREALFCGAV